MIRDTVLVCCIVICCVLFYRMYVLNQKINNLEEKTSVLDNFSQSIFQFVTQKEEARLKQEEEDKLKQEQDNGNTVVYSNNISASEPHILSQKIEEVEETETEDQKYNVNNTGSGEKISETFESKEILSEMVEELNKSSVQNDKEDTEQLLQQTFDQKQEQDGLFNLLSSVDVNNQTETKVLDVHVENKVEVSDKKKEEELNKMSLNEIKALAKIKNISVMKSNKPKKKELLIQELLEA